MLKRNLYSVLVKRGGTHLGEVEYTFAFHPGNGMPPDLKRDADAMLREAAALMGYDVVPLDATAADHVGPR